MACEQLSAQNSSRFWGCLFVVLSWLISVLAPVLSLVLLPLVTFLANLLLFLGPPIYQPIDGQFLPHLFLFVQVQQFMNCNFVTYFSFMYRETHTKQTQTVHTNPFC